jgi:hypothetical protein
MINKPTILAILLAVASNQSFSQTKGQDLAKDYRYYMDSLFSTAGIKRNTVRTGTLYDRAVPISGLQYFKQTDTVSREYFYQATLELGNSSFDSTLYPNTSHIRQLSNRYTYKDKMIPIGILSASFNYVDTFAVKKGLITLMGSGRISLNSRFAREALQEKNVLLVSLLNDSREVDPKTTFILPSQLLMRINS